MKEDAISYRPINIIRSEHTIAGNKLAYAQGCKGLAEVFPEFAAGLREVEGFSHLLLLYHFHQASPSKLAVKPFLRDVEHGVFATRAPCRPNAVGVSVMELLRRDGNSTPWEFWTVRRSRTSNRIRPSLIALRPRGTAGKTRWMRTLRGVVGDGNILRCEDPQCAPS